MFSVHFSRCNDCQNVPVSEFRAWMASSGVPVVSYLREPAWNRLKAPGYVDAMSPVGQ